MHADLDTLVVALYVTIDELLGPRRGPGRPPKFSDAELVCLAVAQVLLGFGSERRWLRFAGQRLGHLFPYLPTASAYNRRLRRAAPLVALAIQDLARRTPSWWDQLRLVDSTPLPCAASRQTVKRSALAGHAGYGYCKSHHRSVWGFRLYVLAAPDGLPVAWCLATPKLGEREVVAALLEHERGRLRPGLLLVGDKGFAGREFDQLVRQYGARLLRPDRADEPRRVGSLGRIRQWVESTFDTLKGQLGLEQHGGRTPQGVWVRVAQRLLALAAGIWWNWQTSAPERVGHRPKWQLTLDMLDELAGWGLAPPLVVADAGDGESGEFRLGLEERQLAYVVQVKATVSAYPTTVAREVVPYGGRGRRPRPRYRTKRSSLRDLVVAAGRPAAKTVAWREGTRGKLHSRFVALQVRPAGVRLRRAVQGGELPARWLLAEWPADQPEPVKYWLANLPAEVPLVELVRLAKLR